MKKFSKVSLVAVCACLLFTRCTNSFSECSNIEKRELILLLDLTDPLLFEIIDNDIQKNFGGFMKKTGLSNISSCSKLNFRMAPITSRDNLTLSNDSIGIFRKGLSIKEERKRADPSLLKDSLKITLEKYKNKSHQPETTSRSVIANVIFKAINSTDQDAESIVLIFSDLVENNDLVNFYRRIPSTTEIPGIIDHMIEPYVRDQFERRQQEGLTVKIIIVLIPEPSGRPNIREIRNFWIGFFNELKLEVQFIDNLTML